MRYQNPLYALVSHGAPGTPKARRGSSSGGSIKQACSDSGAGAAEGCQNCQRLADNIKRLMLEKQELLSDVISTNQAYMRLQRDHTALLQQVAELKHKQHNQQEEQMLLQQQQQSQHLWIKDPAEVPDMVPEQHQHHRADAPRVSISSMIGRLISSDEPKYAASLPDMSPTAGAATADPAFAAAADELVTPRLEPASSPVKRRRARWNKAAPLRNSLKSLGDMLSPAQATSSGGCYPSAGMFSNLGPKPCPVTPPRSPKGAPRSPRGFSRLRASFSGRISFSSGRLSFSGSRLGRRSREAGTSACAEVIDVSVLTQMNTISNSGGGRTPIARVRSSSGGGVSTDASANASLAATPPGGVTAIGDSFKNVSSIRHSVDCIATSAFSTSSSGGGHSSSANGRNALRHSTDSLQNLKPASAGMNSLASKLGLSVRTRRSASFAPGSFSADNTDAGAGRQSAHADAVTTTDALAAFGSPTDATSSAGGWSSITAAAAAPAAAAAAAAAVSSAGGCTSIAAIAGSAGGSSVFSQSQAVPSTHSSFAGPGAYVNRHGVTTVLSSAMADYSSSGGRNSGPRRSSFAADGLALPPLHSSVNSNRYNSAQSHDSASSCCSHRLTGSGVSDASAAEPAAAGAQSEQDSKARSASSSVAGSSSSSGGKGFKSSHLRPVSPKSRALKDLASPTADTPAAAANAPATAVADASAVAAIEMITAAVAAEGGEIFFDAADGSALMLDSAPTMAATDAAAAEPSAATDTKAAAAVKAAAAKGTYNVADAVAELLHPISNPSNAKQVTFLTSRKYGSKRSSFSSTVDESSAAGAHSGRSGSPNQPYFGRVWDKWSKMKLGSPRAGRRAQILADGTGSPTAAAAAAVAAAAAEDGDTAVAAAAPGIWTAEQTQAAAATAAAVEAAALELGMLPAVSTAETDSAAVAAGAAAAAAAADISLAAAATAAATAGKGALGPFDSATKAGAKVVAWPLELDEDELVSRRPSVVA